MSVIIVDALDVSRRFHGLSNDILQANVDKIVSLLVIRNYFIKLLLQHLDILWIKSSFTVLENNRVALTEDFSTKVLDHVRLKLFPIARRLGAHLLELLLFLGLFRLLLVLLDGAGVDTIRD